jgi:hypothetical protein
MPGMPPFCVDRKDGNDNNQRVEYYRDAQAQIVAIFALSN